jgi:hypothetical protein
MGTLKIIIKGIYFDEILKGNKKIEYRDEVPFWTSRLFDKSGKERSYDRIEFINGYNADARRMITEFKGVKLKRGVYEIGIGRILKKIL